MLLRMKQQCDTVGAGHPEAIATCSFSIDPDDITCVHPPTKVPACPAAVAPPLYIKCAHALNNSLVIFSTGTRSTKIHACRLYN